MSERQTNDGIEALLEYADRFVLGMRHNTQQETWEQFGAGTLAKRLREHYEAGSFDPYDDDPTTGHES